ncbi:MAG TPA: hypothetical protein VFK38_09235 [Candidatus Limnocylindrales bacterium]|nr:hypothetical protein [Candidatus Limnocylindrales bacterium]
MTAESNLAATAAPPLAAPNAPAGIAPAPADSPPAPTVRLAPGNAATPTVPLGTRLRTFRAKFRFSQLRRRTLWPFWLGLGLIVLALQAPWTATLHTGYSRSCYSWEWCRTAWVPNTFGGSGSGASFLPVIGLLVVLVGWAAFRRELPRPSWFARLPRIGFGGLVLVALLNVGNLLPPLDSIFSTGTDYLYSGEPAWGVFLFVVALWPTWKGIARVRRALDSAPPAG